MEHNPESLLARAAYLCGDTRPIIAATIREYGEDRHDLQEVITFLENVGFHVIGHVTNGQERSLIVPTQDFIDDRLCTIWFQSTVQPNAWTTVHTSAMKADVLVSDLCASGWWRVSGYTTGWA
jgi:hypothetical protein